MPTTPAFSLLLDQVYFSPLGLPRYPSLIDSTSPVAQALQLEVCLKNADSTQGGFEVIFELAENELAKFRLDANDQQRLSRIDGSPIMGGGWEATTNPARDRCVLKWVDESPPATQVVRVDCIRGLELTHLFLAVIDPSLSYTRITTEEKSDPPLEDPPVFELEPDGGELLYEVFRSGARQQLAAGYQFEPAIRLREDHAEDFAVRLAPETGKQFVPGAGSALDRDEVRVSLYGDEAIIGEGRSLAPTLRPDPQTCTALWRPTSNGTGPAEGFLAFNLEMEDEEQGSSRFSDRRGDPVVIEDPYFPPVVL